MACEPYTGPNNLTYDGARALADRIQQYWHKRGALHVTAYLDPIDRSDGKSPGYGVRSNLINGNPPRLS